MLTAINRMRGCRVESSCRTLARILLIENEPAIIAVCQRILTREGFKVDIAPSSKTVQSMIFLHDYALCLIDVSTRTLDGRELYKWLKERHPRLADRVIFTTGDLMDEETQRFLEQTARPFLVKPYGPYELLNMVNAEIEHKQSGGRRLGSGKWETMV
jgi:DNA-binding response OmpR family regulator